MKALKEAYDYAWAKKMRGHLESTAAIDALALELDKREKGFFNRRKIANDLCHIM